MHKTSLIGTSLATLTLIGCSTVNPDAKSQPEAAPATAADTNPLLTPWSGPYGGVPPWDAGTPERYRTALEAAIAMQLADYDAIVKNPASPTFDNTFIPMQDAGRTFSRVNAMFSVMTSNINTPEYQALNKQVAPKMSAAHDKIIFNEQLFARIQAVYDARETAGLTAEQKRLVERTYDFYVRPGAKLTAAPDKKKLGDDQPGARRARSPTSANKVLADENTWIVLENQADLAGLPDSLLASAAAAADGAQADGQVGGRQHALERRSVPDVLVAARPAREGVEGVQEPRRQRRRQRHQRDDRADREAARRARQAARLRVARALAHGRHDGQGPGEGAGS